MTRVHMSATLTTTDESASGLLAPAETLHLRAMHRSGSLGHIERLDLHISATADSLVLSLTRLSGGTAMALGRWRLNTHGGVTHELDWDSDVAQ